MLFEEVKNEKESAGADQEEAVCEAAQMVGKSFPSLEMRNVRAPG